MRNWFSKKLSEIADIQSGGTPSRTRSDFWNGDIPWYSSGELNFVYTKTPLRTVSELGLKHSNAKLFPVGSLLIGMYDTAALKMSFLDREGTFNQAIAGVRPNAGSNLNFVRYAIQYFKPFILEQRRGVRQKNLSLDKIRQIEIPYPPLPEQRRIVAVLDEAFEGLAIATANTEKNLKNARELFESYLVSVFENNNGNWKSSSIGDECQISTGFAFKSIGYVDEKNGVRLLRGDNIVQGKLRWDDCKFWSKNDVSKFQAYDLAAKDIVLAMDRTWVKAGVKFSQIEPDDLPSLLVQRVARLRAKFGPMQRFVFQLIGSPAFEKYVLGMQTGLSVPHISEKQIASFKFRCPPHSELMQVVAAIDLLSENIKMMEQLYQRKLAAIAELKQSLLQKAFAGELTKDFRPSVAASSAVSRVSSLATVDLHAGVLAMAYDRHFKRDKHKTFGHVKAQKFLHLVESVGRIDLGRMPIKDAAGPNDFQHMLRAEDWARQNEFFDFAQRPSGNGYDFKKLARFDDQLKRANAVLEPIRAALNKVIDLIIDMNSEEVELFATVHAAWNNLIIDNVQITDQAIVREARENWHNDKLKIPEQRFHNALNSIRTRKLEPDGTAKYVGGQSRLI